jgi:hypothetical protein
METQAFSMHDCGGNWGWAHALILHLGAPSSRHADWKELVWTNSHAVAKIKSSEQPRGMAILTHGNSLPDEIKEYA